VEDIDFLLMLVVLYLGEDKPDKPKLMQDIGSSAFKVIKSILL
jgi:hypothetical protein